MRFLKYEFNNKLLDVVTLFRITLSITWTQLKMIYKHVVSTMMFAMFDKNLQIYMDR